MFSCIGLFIYYNGRVLENTVDQDSGLTVADGLKSVNRWGFCSEGVHDNPHWVYDTNKFTVKPYTSCYKAAAQEKVIHYSQVSQDVIDMQTCLAEGFPIIIGFTVYDSFESQAVANTGIVPMPGPRESVLGGHCVLIVGYLPDGRWIVRNSWSAQWGEKGYCIFPKQYLVNPNLSSDYWTIRTI